MVSDLLTEVATGTEVQRWIFATTGLLARRKCTVIFIGKPGWRFVSSLFSLGHVVLVKRLLFDIAICLVHIRANINADMTILRTKARIDVTFSDIGEPSSYAFGQHKFFSRNRVGGTVVRAQIAMKASVLNAKNIGCILRKRD